MSLRYEHYIGIDYSGAQTPASSLKGLRVYESDALKMLKEFKPPPSPRRYWTKSNTSNHDSSATGARR